MRICLPDVNVLIALHDPKHIGHEKAHQWFYREGRRAWATCPLTENGFVRVLTQVQYPNHVEGVTAALYLLENMVSVYGTTHLFWSDNISLRDKDRFVFAAMTGPKQITDVFLLALCQENGGTLVTLDTGITTSAINTPNSDLLRIL